MPDFKLKKILDVGSGPGSSLWSALDSFGNFEEAVLVDKSESMLEMAKSTAPPQYIEQSKIRFSNILETVLSFNSVFSW